MKTALFLHATLNAKNPLDKESLALSHIDSSLTALEYLLTNLLKSRSIDSFYLVTSDSSVDDGIADITEKLNQKRIN